MHNNTACIYKGLGVTPESFEDTQKLLEQSITGLSVEEFNFEDKPLKINKDSNTAVVFPSGNITDIMSAVSNNKDINKAIGAGCHVIAFGASAALAVKANFYKFHYEPYQPGSFSYGCSYSTILFDSAYQSDFHFKSNFSAHLPLIPPRQMIYSKENIDLLAVIPCAVGVTFGQSPKVLAQLYMNGCGFSQSSLSKEDVVATYHDRFPLNKNFTQLQTIVKGQINNQQGNYLLIGTDSQACVENSALLELVKPDAQRETSKFGLLGKDSYKAIVRDQQKTREQIVPLIQQTFGMKK